MRIYCTLLFGIIALSVFGQSELDMFNLGQYQYHGSARSLGAGGAFSAVGGDFTAGSVNPAGFGLYRKSEYGLTPTFFRNATDTRFINKEHRGQRSKFGLSEGHAVYNKMADSKSDAWQGLTFAFGVNRLSDLDQFKRGSDINNENSLITSYLEQANGVADSQLAVAQPYGAGLAYYTFLMDPSPDETNGYSSSLARGGNLQSIELINKGKLREYLVAFGANFKDKMYVGLSIGIPHYTFSEEKYTYEEDIQDDHGDFKSFEQVEEVRSEGFGLNAKLGIITRINDNFRIGGSIHAPARLTIGDTYSTYMQSQFEGAESYIARSTDFVDGEGFYSYDIVLPSRYTFGAALQIQRMAFLSFDYEGYNAAKTRFDFKGFDRQQEAVLNNSISDKYDIAHQFKLGMEIKGNLFFYRAGLAHRTSPFRADVVDKAYNQALSTASIGMGWRSKNFYVDAAAISAIKSAIYVPYHIDDKNEPLPTLKSSIASTRLSLTGGILF